MKTFRFPVFWQQFGEEPQMGVMVRSAHITSHVVIHQG